MVSAGISLVGYSDTVFNTGSHVPKPLVPESQPAEL